ncbi:site-specific integrase [Alkalibacillus silvisoli]|uniref:Tyrosine-type recombinase/integrase n=1 Tax=Alkalibacillus silvisoli TaxID=392823 RepID=A0ABN0ZQ70_9BACI
MAYIYKRGKKWAYRAYAGKNPITGNDKQVSKSGFLTKKDAQLAAAMFERQFHKGEYIEPSALTFEDLTKEWEKHYSVDAKESSVRARNKALKHAIAKFGNDSIQSINKQEYQAFIDEISKKFSRNYVSSIHTSANMVFEYAHGINLIQGIPTEKIRLPKKKKTVHDIENESIRDKFLEKEELEEFLLMAKNNGLESDLLLFTTLAYTGLRIGELLALKWSDIDFEAHTLRVSKTYYNPNNNKKAYQLLTPKTDKSIRTITIDEIVVNLLLEHKHEQDEIKKENEPFYKDESFIFATNEGYPKTIRLVGMRMERLLNMTNKGKKDDEKKYVTPHSFRHTHTSLLIEANVHIKEIQERLGHSDINTTMDIYAHMTKGIKKEASTRFSNLMESLSKNIYDKT